MTFFTVMAGLALRDHQSGWRQSAGRPLPSGQCTGGRGLRGQPRAVRMRQRECGSTNVAATLLRSTRSASSTSSTSSARGRRPRCSPSQRCRAGPERRVRGCGADMGADKGGWPVRGHPPLSSRRAFLAGLLSSAIQTRQGTRAISCMRTTGVRRGEDPGTAQSRETL